MTVTSLAISFNDGAIVMVIALSLLVSLRYSHPFFTAWLRGYFCGFLLLLTMLLPVDRFPVLTLLAYIEVLLNTGFFLQTGLLLQEKPPPKFIWPVLSAVFLLCLGMMGAGLPLKKIILLPLLFSWAASLYLSSLFLFRLKFFNRLTSACWLGIPLALLYTSSLLYPFVPASFEWLGYSLAAVLHLFVGSGMVFMLLEKKQEELNQMNAKTVALEQEKVALHQERIATLEEANRIKEDFLGVVSHEMRTPLSAVIGFGSFLRDEMAGPLNPKQADFLTKMLRGADRMLMLIDDMLDFARIQAGKFGISMEETDYRSLVKETIEAFQPSVEAKKLQIESKVEVPEFVYLDQRRIQQVISNLLSNAIKFTPAGGRIRLRSWVEGDRLVTEVSDTGLGIPPEDLPKLFAPFKQLDMTSTRQFSGVGLGLSIVKSIVEAHDGQLGVQSTPGEGSNFWFKLPLAPTESWR